MNFSITVDVNATPERVWTVMSDIERWHEWTPSVKSITRLDRGPLARGSRARNSVNPGHSAVSSPDSSRG